MNPKKRNRLLREAAAFYRLQSQASDLAERAEALRQKLSKEMGSEKVVRGNRFVVMKARVKRRAYEVPACSFTTLRVYPSTVKVRA